MKKLAMLVAVLGMTTASFAQEAPAKPVKHKKHQTEAKSEVTKPESKNAKADAPKAETAKAKK